MKLPKIKIGTIAFFGAATYFIVPKLLRELDKTQAFINQKITKFSPQGISFAQGKLMAKFLTSIEISNKNVAGFPIQDLGVKLFYKNSAGQFSEVATTIPNFEKYLLIGAKNNLPSITEIKNIELLVDPAKIPGLVSSLFQFTKGIEFQVQSDLKVYGLKISTSTPYTL